MYDELYSIFKNLSSANQIYVMISEKKRVLEKKLNSYIKESIGRSVNYELVAYIGKFVLEI